MGRGSISQLGDGAPYGHGHLGLDRQHCPHIASRPVGARRGLGRELGLQAEGRQAPVPAARLEAEIVGRTPFQKGVQHAGGRVHVHRRRMPHPIHCGHIGGQHFGSGVIGRRPAGSPVAGREGRIVVLERHS